MKLLRSRMKIKLKKYKNQIKKLIKIIDIYIIN